jgi:hypothetical protein
MRKTLGADSATPLLTEEERKYYQDCDRGSAAITATITSGTDETTLESALSIAATVTQLTTSTGPLAAILRRTGIFSGLISRPTPDTSNQAPVATPSVKKPA